VKERDKMRGRRGKRRDKIRKEGFFILVYSYFP